MGQGRADPNHSPFLPAPEGRIKLAMNPFNFVHQVLGEQLCNKAMKFVCLFLCITFILGLAPSIVANLITVELRSFVSSLASDHPIVFMYGIVPVLVLCCASCCWKMRFLCGQ